VLTAQGLSWALGVEREILSSSSIWVESSNEYATAFAAMLATGAEALVIVSAPELYRDTEQLGALAAKNRLPTIEGFRESVQAGLLIGYGPSLRELDRHCWSLLALTRGLSKAFPAMAYGSGYGQSGHDGA
jgi:hypothetical protein